MMDVRENPVSETGLRRIVVNHCVLREDGIELIRCRQDTGSVMVPDPVEVIGPFAFWNGKISHITLPSSVREIREYAFLQCRHLTGITLYEGLEKIGFGAFWGCSSPKEIRLPESVRFLDSEVFHSAGIAELTLPENLECVNPLVLHGCKLQRLTILGKPQFAGELCAAWDLQEDVALVADALPFGEYPEPYTPENGLLGFAARWRSGEAISPAAVGRFRQYLCSAYRQYRTDPEMLCLMASIQAIPPEQIEDALSLAMEKNDPTLTAAVLTLQHEMQQ